LYAPAAHYRKLTANKQQPALYP